ncbi:hypothetical protein B0H19DRAFT_1068742 [Mycena capillaripes]|nr:hypothetical protein B0H19DRAFT_1068742 [Mycena capillaripes]
MAKFLLPSVHFCRFLGPALVSTSQQTEATNAPVSTVLTRVDLKVQLCLLPSSNNLAVLIIRYSAGVSGVRFPAAGALDSIVEESMAARESCSRKVNSAAIMNARN